MATSKTRSSRAKLPECQLCFDEEGSYACIRPAHPKYNLQLDTKADRLDQWLEKFTRKFDEKGLAYLDERAWEGFLAGVGEKERVRELHELIELYRREHIYKKPYQAPTMSENDVVFNVKSVAGRILTIIDAMFPVEQQNKALKTLIKKEFREQLNRIFKKLHMDGGCETGESAEDRAARELEL